MRTLFVLGQVKMGLMPLLQKFKPRLIHTSLRYTLEAKCIAIKLVCTPSLQSRPDLSSSLSWISLNGHLSM